LHPSKPPSTAARGSVNGVGGGGGGGGGHDPAAADFERRVEDLRERYPGFEQPLPADARHWAPEDLENYVESGGFIKPKASLPPKASSKPQAPREDAVDGPQFAVADALKLQDQLYDGFKAKDFQDRLHRLQAAHPQRKQRGHTDGARFFEAFETLALTVYSRVLPRYGLLGDWDGVQDMHARMTAAMKHPKVKKKQEEINLLLGLPRDAVLRPTKKAEEAFVFRPNRDGDVPGYLLPLLVDDDGDWAHEFLVEDPVTGNLRITRSTKGCVATKISRQPPKRG